MAQNKSQPPKPTPHVSDGIGILYGDFSRAGCATTARLEGRVNINAARTAG